MDHRDIQLIKKIISEGKDIIKYTSEIGERVFHENDVYQKATAMSLLNMSDIPMRCRGSCGRSSRISSGLRLLTLEIS